jgi:hypothetical protein
MQNIDYYLDVLNEPDGDYPKCPNHSDNLTVEGCMEAANLMGERFVKAWEKSAELMYGKQQDGN